jgi:hypothetical protein
VGWSISNIQHPKSNIQLSIDRSINRHERCSRWGHETLLRELGEHLFERQALVVEAIGREVGPQVAQESGQARQEVDRQEETERC